MIIPFAQYFEKLFSGQTKWYVKYLGFLLFFGIIFINVALIFRSQKGDLKLAEGRTGSLVLFFFFFTTCLFCFFQASEKCGGVKNLFLRCYFSSCRASYSLYG
jgi:hypothetical protein